MLTDFSYFYSFLCSLFFLLNKFCPCTLELKFNWMCNSLISSVPTVANVSLFSFYRWYFCFWQLLKISLPIIYKVDLKNMYLLFGICWGFSMWTSIIFIQYFFDKFPSFILHSLFFFSKMLLRYRGLKKKMEGRPRSPT